MKPLLTHRITSELEIGFSALFEIYAEAIPAGESKSREELTEMVRSPNYCVLLFEASGAVVGFSMLFLPELESYALLEYMAVSKGYRSRGLGSELFQTTISTDFLPARYEAVVVEIDSPREQTAPDREIRARRRNFYQRNGCMPIPDLDYLFPLVCAAPAPQMDLLIHFRHHRQTVSKEKLRRWLASIFAEVYAMARDDRRIEQMLRNLRDPVV
jgi:hypothetical protein